MAVDIYPIFRNNVARMLTLRRSLCTTIICSTNHLAVSAPGAMTVMDYFSDLDNPDLSPVGRLDRATEGLLLVTDDGMFNQKLTHPSYKKEKTYLFTAMGTLSEEDLYALEHGVQLTGSDRLTAPAHVCVTATSVLKEVLPTLHPEIQSASCHNRPEHPIVFGEITVTEGKKHQVRRMLKAVGCCIIALKRVTMGNFTLDETLAPGEFKEIFPKL